MPKKIGRRGLFKLGGLLPALPGLIKKSLEEQAEPEREFDSAACRVDAVERRHPYNWPTPTSTTGSYAGSFPAHLSASGPTMIVACKDGDIGANT